MLASPKKFYTFFRLLMGFLYLAAGLNHFLNTAFYMPLMPPYLPFPIELIYISGWAEMVLGAMVLFPRYQNLAAWGIIALLVAVFPANIHLAQHPELFPAVPPIVFWLRLPLQVPLILWAYAYTKNLRRP